MPKLKVATSNPGSAFKTAALGLTALGIASAVINYYPCPNSVAPLLNPAETEKAIAVAVKTIRATQVALPWYGSGATRVRITESPFGKAECVSIYYSDGHSTLVMVNGKPYASLPVSIRFASCDDSLLKKSAVLIEHPDGGTLQFRTEAEAEKAKNVLLENAALVVETAFRKDPRGGIEVKTIETESIGFIPASDPKRPELSSCIAGLAGDCLKALKSL